MAVAVAAQAQTEAEASEAGVVMTPMRLAEKGSAEAATVTAVARRASL